MDKILSRFYDVSIFFRDDERLMTLAIKEHLEVKVPKHRIYYDLLNCRHKKWIDRLEAIAPKITDEWLDCREFMLDNGHDKMWLKGDMVAIEEIFCREVSE